MRDRMVDAAAARTRTSASGTARRRRDPIGWLGWPRRAMARAGPHPPWGGGSQGFRCPPSPRPLPHPPRPPRRQPAARGPGVRSAGFTVAAFAALPLSPFGPGVGRARVSADGAPPLPAMTFYGRGYGHG